MPGRPRGSRKSLVSKKERLEEYTKIRNDQEFNESKPKKDDKKAEDKPEESE